MDQATRDWLRKHSISSWRRVVAAALVAFALVVLEGYLRATHPSASYVLVPLALALSAFVLMSLGMTLVSLLPGAITQRDLWHPFVRFVIRDTI
jgi:predicted benzoate:H+ symporter BenE